jgi:hypothetical protein
MLAMALPKQLGRDAMFVSSHAGDHAVDVTWLWCDVGADDHATVTPGLICT